MDAEQAVPGANLFPGRWAGLNRRPRLWLWGMVLLQVCWLLLIRILEINAAPQRVLPVLLLTLLLASGMIYLPASFYRRLTGMVTRRVPGVTGWMVAVLTFFAVVGVVFAAEQRIWPTDEEVLYSTAVTVSEGGLGALLATYRQYPWLANQHPPLAAAFYGYALRLLGPALLAGRLVTLALALAAAWLTFRLGRRLSDAHGGLLAALFLLSMPLVYRLGTVVMVEIMLLFMTMAAVTLTLYFAAEPRLGRFLLLAVVVVVGIFIKYTMVLLLPVLGLWVLFYRPWAQVRRFLWPAVGLGVLFVVVFLLALPRIPVLQMQMENLLNYAGLVMTDPYGRQLLLETMSNRLPSAIGVYHVPVLLLGGLASWQRFRTAADRREWLQRDGLLWVWILCIWLALSLTLPDHRYFLATFPAIALLMAWGVEDAGELFAAEMPFFTLRVALLSQLLALSTLPIFVDWQRVNQIFVGS
jgi:4-amino-4-deoxy-L-arabinose transferase-like glycosyltransferase